MDHFFKFRVAPFAELLAETIDAADNRAGCPGCLVHLDSYVELRRSVTLLFDAPGKVFVFQLGKVGFVLLVEFDELFISIARQAGSLLPFR